MYLFSSRKFRAQRLKLELSSIALALKTGRIDHGGYQRTFLYDAPVANLKVEAKVILCEDRRSCAKIIILTPFTLATASG